MIWFSLILLLVIGLFAVLLGWYRTEILWKADGDHNLLSLRVRGWRGLFSMRIDHDNRGLHQTYRILGREIDRSGNQKTGGKRRRKRKQKPKKRGFSLKYARIAARLVPRLVRRCLSAVVLKRGFLMAQAGTGDPALTGELTGAVYALKHFLPESMHIEFMPDFQQRIILGEGEFIMDVSAGRLVGAGFRGAAAFCWQYLKGK